MTTSAAHDDRSPEITIALRLLRDAAEAVTLAIDGVPAPGRGASIGRLNTLGWTVAHIAHSYDSWMGYYILGNAPDDWCADWATRGRAAGIGNPLDTPLDEALAAFERVRPRSAEGLARLDESALFAPLERLRGSPLFREEFDVAYLLLRGSAHLFTHAGELSVLASLMGSGDLGLPGALARSGEVAATDPVAPRLVPHLLDAYDEYRRIADALPAAAYGATIERLNSGGFIVGHVANREDLIWNVGVAGRPRDAWLATHDVGPGSIASAPPYEEARATLERVLAASTGTLERLRPTDLGRTFDYRGRPTTVTAQLVRSIAHLWVHAGELAAIGSLVGMADAVLPGTLSRSARPVT